LRYTTIKRVEIDSLEKKGSVSLEMMTPKKETNFIESYS